MGLFGKKKQLGVGARTPFGKPTVPLPTTSHVPSSSLGRDDRTQLRVHPGSLVTMSAKPAKSAVVISTYRDGEYKIAMGSEIVRVDSRTLRPGIFPAPEASTLGLLLRYLQAPVTGRTLMDDWRATRPVASQASARSASDVQESVQMRAGKRALATPNDVRHGYADSGPQMDQDEAYRKYFGK